MSGLTTLSPDADDLGKWEPETDDGEPYHRLIGPTVEIAGTVLHIAAIEVQYDLNRNDGSMYAVDDFHQELLSALEETVESAMATIEFADRYWVIYASPTPAAHFREIDAAIVS
jgi:hypothetical protein